MLPEVQYISGDDMKTNNALKNYPKSFAEYNALKPAILTPYEWLTHPTNEHKFPTRIYKLIRKIDSLAKKHGHSYAHLDTIAFYLKISRRTLQRDLRKLTTIEVLEEKIEGNDRRYKVNWNLLGNNNTHKTLKNKTSQKNTYSKNTDIPRDTPAYFVNTDKQIIYPQNGDTPVNILNHHGGISTITIVVIREEKTPTTNDIDDTLSDSNKEEDKKEQKGEKDSTVKADATNNLNDLTKLDPIEEEIKKEFETTTNLKLNLKRDSQALKQLKDLFTQAKDVVLEAFRNVADYLAQSKGKVYSLGYVLTTAKNLLRAKSRPKKDYLSQEDKRNLEIGGKASRGVAASPEELKQASLELQIQEKNLQLREELFDNLDEASKQELIEDAIEIIKTQTPNVWEKIKPKFPWFDKNLSITHAIDRVKDLLLKEHLEYQEHLFCSG